MAFIQLQIHIYIIKLLVNNKIMDEDYKRRITEQFLIIRREERNKLLAQTNKYLIADFPITPENLELVKQYRQELRDYMNLEEVINFDYYSETPIRDFPKFPF